MGALMDARDRELRGVVGPGIPSFGEIVERLTKDPPDGRPINWLKIAVYMMGGIDKVAEIMDVTKATVYGWLQRGRVGVRRLQYYQVEKIAKLTGIRIDLIGDCGSENEPGDEPKRPAGKRSARSKRSHGH